MNPGFAQSSLEARRSRFGSTGSGLAGRAVIWIAFAAVIARPAAGEDRYAEARRVLVETRIASDGVSDPRVLEAIRQTPRHEFVSERHREHAYLDMALPIGQSQTISSPFIVASMTEALDPQPQDKVLEIGTGSGYQAAVLSPLVAHVYSIEIVPELGEHAAQTLERLGYDNVSTRIGDGFLGWPDAAPFDKIIVTCSPESVPRPLVDQLREGGQMIIPVGQRYQQTLYRMTKQNGELVREALRPTLFVPMTGEAEDQRQTRPDGSQPRVVNGGFETPPDDQQVATEDYVPGWYYGRQLRLVVAAADDPAPGGSAFARFSNQTPGLNSHLLQGIAIDGREVPMIRLRGKVRTHQVRRGPNPEAMPAIAISFYDQARRELGTFGLGPFGGTRSWRTSSKLIRVPVTTREAILRIGLFGATGLADFDDVGLSVVD